MVDLRMSLGPFASFPSGLPPILKNIGPVLVPRVSSPRAEENEVVTGPRMTPRHHFEVYSSAGEEEEEEEEEEK
ncbi:hypothetical protein MJT46_005340, partial [Ovis ammon polii x Ovis aries]